MPQSMAPLYTPSPLAATSFTPSHILDHPPSSSLSRGALTLPDSPYLGGANINRIDNHQYSGALLSPLYQRGALDATGLPTPQTPSRFLDFTLDQSHAAGSRLADEYATLRQQYHELSIELRTLQTSHEQLLAVVSASLQPPARILTLQERLDDPTTGPLKEDDFKDTVRFWHKKTYNGPTNASNVEELGNKHACHFLEDETGQVIDVWRVNVIRERARAFWIQLYYAGKAPLQWSYAPLDTMQEFHQCMNHFKEFRLCADDWKADQLGFKYYSGWLTKFKNSHPGIKQELWDEPINVEPGRSSLKREAEGTPIELDEDTPAPVPKKQKISGGKSSSSKGKAVIKMKNPFAVPALAAADSTSTTPALSSALPVLLSTSPAPSSALLSAPPVLSSTSPAQPSVSPTDATTYANTSTDTLAATPNTAANSGTSHGDCEAHATGGNKNGATLTATGVTNTLQDTVTRTPGDTEVTMATPVGSREDPPAPAAVPAADVAAPAVQSVAVTGKKSGARMREGAGSLYTPTSSLTVRNLCGMEWKKANPKGTTGAFGAYYDSLTEAEKDWFAQLSKAKKAEAKASVVKDTPLATATASTAAVASSSSVA
ncbi:hypothetical protein B0H21DRAFT_825364 [Amylocystis lapponica]|nr:hypothetical protein B0H21DRAFT_825364 [Amylocystis lapponica]